MRTKLRFVEELVSPLKAKLFLEANAGNRRLDPVRAGRFADAMREGRWHLNGESIKLASSGRLLDGQHRLRAIVMSGCTVRMLVCYGVDEGSFATIDTGRPRSGGDVLSFAGVQNGNQVSTALSLVHRYLSNTMGAGSRSRPPNDQLVRMYEEHPRILESLPYGRLSRAILRSVGRGTGLHYLLTASDRDLADAFMGALSNGVGLKAHDPVLVLRNRLISHSTSKAKLPGGYVNALCIRAWNAFYEGRPMKSLRWSEHESFPEIAGFDEIRLGHRPR